MRFEATYLDPALDGRTGEIERLLEPFLAESPTDESAGLTVAIVDVYFIEGLEGLEAASLSGLFCDPIVQQIRLVVDPDPTPHGSDEPGFDLAVEIAYRAGVTDPVAITARRALEDLVSAEGRTIPSACEVRTARRFEITFGRPDAVPEPPRVRLIAAKLHNPLIQRETIVTADGWRSGARFPASYPHRLAPSDPVVHHFDVAAMNDYELADLSKERLLALNPEEMAAVRSHFADPAVVDARRAAGLPKEATDVELEMIAQTWSEHCKHKILNATIRYRSDGADGDEERIESLFATCIRGTTEALADQCGYLRSVFHDNSGVIEFDEETLICFKVETHNSPSALDPYGGAITGIVGVNRDILGTGKGAKPIFNTDVLCFARPDTPPGEVPEGLLHPSEVLRGVHRGIVDGGNQSGIPTVAGAFLFDESYLGKPLVFCGTGGILPAEIGGEGSWIKHIDPGDLAVMVGGRIGKDGIHGATFSSLALDSNSPTSAVQIGDPITQKLMTDFLLQARDAGLYRGITDNGAGGLSSSLGEMAEIAGGITIDLDACPLKYEGLAPWEILVSESQERMSLAVSEETIDEFLVLAARRDVEATVVGRFNDSGSIEVRHSGAVVAKLPLEFLHDGLPVMEIEAVWEPPDRREIVIEEEIRRNNGGPATTAAIMTEARSGGSLRLADLDAPSGLVAAFLAVLAEPNVASKEPLVRQYDHEVQAMSIVKPFTGVGADAPTDGAVLRPRHDRRRGITVTHGVCPRVGDIDAYEMARCAVDEAYRAHIALGGNPDIAAGLDNFSWPDPVVSDTNPHGRHRAAQLVRACRGLAEVCLDYGIPLISGKDSMKNDARVGGRVISVRPTLLVSLLGIIDDVERAMTTDFRMPGDLVYLAGPTRGALAASTLERVLDLPLDRCPTVETESAGRRYRSLAAAVAEGLVASVHDCSDGGLAVALAESAIGGGLGVEVRLEAIPGCRPDAASSRILFDESPSRFVVSIPAESREAFESLMAGTDTELVGTVTAVPEVTITREGQTIVRVAVPKLAEAFRGSLS